MWGYLRVWPHLIRKKGFYSSYTPFDPLSGVSGHSRQFAEYSVVGAKRIFPFDISGEPSFAQGLGRTFPAAAAHISYDGLSVSSPNNFGIHAGTLQHAHHTAL